MNMSPESTHNGERDYSIIAYQSLYVVRTIFIHDVIFGSTLHVCSYKGEVKQYILGGVVIERRGLDSRLSSILYTPKNGFVYFIV